MGNILFFFSCCVLLVIWLREFSYLYFMAICVVFSSLTDAIDEIIKNYKLDRTFKFKNIPSIRLLRLLFCLFVFLLFCICKWTGFI